MANEIKLPELGEGIEGAQVLSVLVKAGDSVRADQTVIEVETEKATAEVPSDFAGVVTSVAVSEGDEIKVGQLILTLDSAGAEVPGAGAAEPGGSAAPATEAPPAEAPVVPAAEPAAPVESAPSPAPASAPAPTPAAAPSEPAGVKPAGMLPPMVAAAVESASAKIVSIEGSAPAAAGLAVASPSVRRLARELGIDIQRVPATGAGGRVTEEDVKSFVRGRINQAATAAPAASAAPAEAAPAQGVTSAPALPDFSQWGDVERLPMSGTRRATAEAMSRAWTTAPMVTQFDKADITELEAYRKSYAKRAEAAGVKITVTAIAVKAVAAALRVFPEFNASVDPANGEIIFKKYVSVGVAVDTDRGLLVPVIRDTDTKNVQEIARDLGDLSARARDKKIQLDELKGGTFSVSNLGGLGTTYFSPIVNWPEVAILGMGRANTEAVYTDGEFTPRLILPLAVTYDHRIIDGANAARFLRWIAEALENPVLLALEG